MTNPRPHTEAEGNELEALDTKIIELVKRRCELAVQQMSGPGAGPGLPPSVRAWDRIEAPAGAPAGAGQTIHKTQAAVLREIYSAEVALQKPSTVAFLGPEATHTHQAAIHCFGNAANAVGRKTIDDVFEDVEKGRADFGVVPVENSTYGGVSNTFDMFHTAAVKICAELNLRIHHHLLSLGDLADLKVIYSRDQGFGQCRRWLQQNLPQCRLVDVESTAAAARKAAADPTAAAIASALAADHYGLTILQRNIEDLKENITRFLVIGRTELSPTGDDKTSLMLVIKDRVGALFDALKAFNDSNVNLTLIESRPSRQKSWTYFFFVDFTGHMSDDQSQQLLGKLAQHCESVKHLGSYPRARTVEE